MTAIGSEYYTCEKCKEGWFFERHRIRIRRDLDVEFFSEEESRRVAARPSDMLIDYLCANCGHPLSRTGRPSVMRVPNPFEQLRKELLERMDEAELKIKNAVDEAIASFSSDGVMTVEETIKLEQGQDTGEDAAKEREESEPRGDADGVGADSGGAGGPQRTDEKAGAGKKRGRKRKTEDS